MRFVAHGERGTALAEMVVVMPLLLTMLIGFVELGRYADYSIRVANAARAGAQYAAQNLDTAADVAGITAAATADTASASNVSISASTFCTCADGSADANCVVATCSANHRIVYAQVQSTGSLRALFGYSGLPAGLGSFSITRQAVMRVAE